MWIGVISLFPEMFKAITEFGVTGRAVKHNLLQVECWNPRDFTFDKHKTVDDRPYGGGPGMLMSGHHEEIRKWRLKQSLQRTWLRRPELLEGLALTDEQRKLLKEAQAEYNS